ncbi:DUF4349 domain-containing protein [Emticicia soli]|uniref:DUF4349 domain-containing protein n=1 Tax=Emticicia soli TaxID=2027878 RepID=A0ABW5J0V0_9BACT
MRFIFLSKTVLFGAIGCFFVACSGQNENTFQKTEENIALDSAMVEPQTGVTTDKPQRKFIRTADLQFKVKDVRKSSEEIEDLTTKYGGFIAYSNLYSDILDKKTVIISRDSVLEVSSINIQNAINIRVPNQNLQALLKDLNGMMLYVNHRIIKAEDVSLQMLSHELYNKRVEKFSERAQSVHQHRKGDIAAATDAEDTVLSRQLSADEHKVQNMNLQDQVDFSTVTINLYQNTILDKAIIENHEGIDSYRTNVFLRIWDSIKAGWIFFEDVIVVLARLWIFLLLSGIAFWVWQYRNRLQSSIKS